MIKIRQIPSNPTRSTQTSLKGYTGVSSNPLKSQFALKFPRPFSEYKGLKVLAGNPQNLLKTFPLHHIIPFHTQSPTPGHAPIHPPRAEAPTHGTVGGVYEAHHHDRLSDVLGPSTLLKIDGREGRGEPRSQQPLPIVQIGFPKLEYPPTKLTFLSSHLDWTGGGVLLGQLRLFHDLFPAHEVTHCPTQSSNRMAATRKRMTRHSHWTYIAPRSPRMLSILF